MLNPVLRSSLEQVPLGPLSPEVRLASQRAASMGHDLQAGKVTEPRRCTQYDGFLSVGVEGLALGSQGTSGG